MDQKSKNLHGGRKYNLKHFSCWLLIPNIHGCWINQKILCPVGLTRWWSDRLVVNLIPKSLELHFGQRVLYGDLQRLDYILGDMHTPTLKIMEDIEFQIGLIVKLNWRNCRLEFELYSSVWTIETNTFRHH
jgi:hypothetical protein